MKRKRQPLFCYCLIVGEREFAIQVTHDGWIHWDDYQERRRAGAGSIRGNVSSESDKFTVTLPLEAALLPRIREAAALFRAGKWTVAHERRLDEHLIPIFWTQVNARLVHPLERLDGDAGVNR